MSLTDPNTPYFLKVSWEDKSTVLDVKAASRLLYELEMRKGIKASFTLHG